MEITSENRHMQSKNVEMNKAYGIFLDISAIIAPLEKLSAHFCYIDSLC